MVLNEIGHVALLKLCSEFYFNILTILVDYVV